MKTKRLPMNLKYLSNQQQRIAGLLPVKVLDIYDNTTGDFHTQGLYSNEIFGRVGSKERNTRHGFINLRCKILHPKTLDELGRLGGLYTGIMSGRVNATWDDKLKDFVKADLLTGQTGYAFFMSHFHEIRFKETKSHARALRIQLLDRFRSLSDIHFWVVMPAGLRDVRVNESGRPIEDDINKLYRKILIASNGIPDGLAFKNDPSLDQIRWNLQQSVKAVYDNILNILGGKKGFLQSKWGSRKIAHGTRNVITAMDPGCDGLNNPRSFDNSTTLVGLHQTLKGIEPLITRYEMVHGIASELIANIDHTVQLIDKKTWKPVPHTVSEKERVSWATKEGRSNLLNRFEAVGNRHKPVMIDGHYFKLIYQDDKHFRIMDSIEDLPADRKRDFVRPLSWAEYLYLTCVDRVDKVRIHLTRYPVTGIESSYPSKPYLRTTMKTHMLRELNSQWEEDADSRLVLEFPDTASNSAFFDTVSPHITQLRNLGADFDGDTVSVTFVFSDEAIAEIDRKLNDPDHYLTPNGEIAQDTSVKGALDLVLKNFNGFREARA